jgi:hypothetical protein
MYISDEDSSQGSEEEYEEGLIEGDDIGSDSDNESNVSISDSDSDSDNEVVIEFDEFSDDENDEIEIERIYNEDVHHLESDKTHGKYYIGLCKYMPNPKFFLMLNTISSRAYFRHNGVHVLKYLYYYGSVRLQCPKIEIMKLEIVEDGTYSVVLKTHWIRLIQRHWRLIFAKRQAILNARKKINNIRTREITGKFPYGLNVLPNLIGILRYYSN